MPAESRPDPLEHAYRAETAALIGARLPRALVFYLLGSMFVMVFDAVFHVGREMVSVVRFAIDSTLCLGALYSVRRSRLRPYWTVGLVTAMFVAIATLNAAYNVVVAGQAERFVMVQITVLNVVAVLFPWGWRPHAVVSVAVMLAYVGAAPHMVAVEQPMFGGIVLGVGCAVATMAAGFMDRYRRKAFWSEAHAREAAEVAEVLHAAAQQLAAVTDRQDPLVGVNQLAAATCGADWSVSIVFDPAMRVYRVRAASGFDPVIEQEIVQACFPVSADPDLAWFQRSDPLEIPDFREDGRMPAELAERWGMASALAMPILRGDEPVGVIAVGRRVASGVFDERQRRLMVGLARATAVALENVRLVDDLRAANAFKSEFVSTMSHELRTPLNVILGFGEMACDDAVDAATREQALDRIQLAAAELHTLIEDTLEIGRIEAGRDEVRLQRFDLRRWWAELGATAERMPRAESVALVWRESMPNVAVLSDPRKLSVIVRNLVGNACKFTEAGSVVAEASADGAELSILVRDTGVGIASADQDAIFDMFRQGDGSDRRRHGGLGLGLHIVKRFASQLGGAVDVTSEEGAGSTFSVRVPIAMMTPRRDAA